MISPGLSPDSLYSCFASEMSSSTVSHPRVLRLSTSLYWTLMNMTLRPLLGTLLHSINTELSDTRVTRGLAGATSVTRTQVNKPSVRQLIININLKVLHFFRKFQMRYNWKSLGYSFIWTYVEMRDCVDVSVYRCACACMPNSIIGNLASHKNARPWIKSFIH